MGLDIEQARRRWEGVESSDVGQILNRCSGLLGQVLRTEHGPLGDVYAEFATFGAQETGSKLPGAPEALTTVYTETALDGTKSVTLFASFSDHDTFEILQLLFEEVDDLLAEVVEL